MTIAKELKFIMVENVNGIAYIHLGYIKPRLNGTIKPWDRSGLLDNPLSLDVLNLEGIDRPTQRIILVNHGNYRLDEISRFVDEFNNSYTNRRRIVGVIYDDRELQCIRCALLN